MPMLLSDRFQTAWRVILWVIVLRLAVSDRQLEAAALMSEWIRALCALSKPPTPSCSSAGMVGSAQSARGGYGSRLGAALCAGSRSRVSCGWWAMTATRSARGYAHNHSHHAPSSCVNTPKSHRPESAWNAVPSCDLSSAARVRAHADRTCPQARVEPLLYLLREPAGGGGRDVRIRDLGTLAAASPADLRSEVRMPR